MVVAGPPDATFVTTTRWQNGVLVANGAFSIPLVPIGDAGSAGCCPAEGSFAQQEFVADAENLLLSTITSPQEIVENRFNPLVLTGPTGVGKSLLAHGLVHRWKCEDPSAEVHSGSGADFCRLFREAIDTDAIEEYRRSCRNVDILLIDDVTDLSGKEAVQRELVNTIDSLLANQRVVIVTSRVTPARLQFIPQLSSRLVQGLVLPLKLPGPAARHELILRLADRHDLRLPSQAIELLVQSGPQSASGLNGVLLQAKSNLPGDAGALDRETMSLYLDDQNGQTKLTVNSLAKMVARRFRLRVADLKSSSRRQAIVRARGAAMYLARQYTEISLEQLGKYFGKRDHTTVLHACRQTQERLVSDSDLREAIDDIANQVGSPPPKS